MCSVEKLFLLYELFSYGILIFSDKYHTYKIRQTKQKVVIYSVDNDISFNIYIHFLPLLNCNDRFE